MEKAVADVLQEYEDRIARERTAGATIARDDRLLAVGPDTGAFLRLLVEGEGSRRILELGTSYGYSTVWLALAARKSGGKVTSLDVSPAKQDYARQALSRAGLADQVEFMAGDALSILPTLEAGIDFVLLDIWKDLYVACLERLLPRLSPGALIVADNMVRPESARQEALAYRRAVRAVPGATSLLLSMGTGIEVSRIGPAPTDDEL